MQLGKLEKIDDLRRIWPHEALDFMDLCQYFGHKKLNFFMLPE